MCFGFVTSNVMTFILIVKQSTHIFWIDIIINIIIIIISCLTCLDNSKPIQKRISVNHEGLSTPNTT